MTKSVVLLSAGLDSTVNLFLAHEKTEVVLALTFDYGQRAALREVDCASQMCKDLNIPHQVVSLGFMKKFGNSSLINEDYQIPTAEKVEIDNLQISKRTAKSVWVPNRNGIFLNIAAGYAEALGAQQIIPGFNIEEATTFPDNTQDFLAAATNAFSYSTANRVQAVCYTTNMNKIQIIEQGMFLKIDWSKIWPCYFSYEKWCGECESCQRAKRAFEKNRIKTEGNFLK